MKDHLEPHRLLLAHAAGEGLPDHINRKNTDIPMGTLQELVEEGYVNAIDANSDNGPCYLEARITVSGREYLNALEKRTEEASLKGKAKRFGLFLFGWLAGVLSSVAVTWATKLL